MTAGADTGGNGEASATAGEGARLDAATHRLVLDYTGAVIGAPDLVMLGLVVAFWGAVPAWQSLLLLGCYEAVSVAMFLLRRRFHQVRPPPERVVQWIRGYALLSVLTGAAWGTAFLLLPDRGSLDEQLFVLMVLLAVTTASVITRGGYLPSFVAFNVPVFLAVVAGLAVGGDPLGYLMAGFAALMALSMWRWAKLTHRNLRETLRLRFENAELIDRLRLARDEAERARDAAQAGDRAKSEFLAMMSHEVRTPLNGILGMAHLLATGPLEARQRDQVDTLRSSAEGLLTVLNDVLDLSSLEAGRLAIHELAFSPVALVEDVVNLMLPSATARGLELDCDLGGLVRSSRVAGDPARIRQILFNLVGNAVKFTEDGRVTVRLRVADGGAAGRARLRMEVEDTGIGIPAEAQAKLFQRFRQVDQSISRRYGGTGLGLAISRQLAELMGGTIGVTSRAGAGSLFWFEVPVDRLPDAEAEPQVAADASLHGLDVLLAEDNPVNRDVTAALIRRQGGRVRTVVDGAQAVDAVRAERPDVVLMDVQMPVMDGLEAIRRIRAGEPPGRRLPVIALTAHTGPDDVADCLAAGADAHLAKPIRPAQLFAALAGVGWTRAAGGTAVRRELVDSIGEAAADDIMRDYERELERLGDAVEAAVNGNDLVSLGRLSHDVKTVAGMLGLAELAARAQAVSRGPRDRRPPADHATVHAFLDVLARLRRPKAS